MTPSPPRKCVVCRAEPTSGPGTFIGKACEVAIRRYRAMPHDEVQRATDKVITKQRRLQVAQCGLSVFITAAKHVLELRD